MEALQSHFKLCEHPRIIKNKYSGDEILVPCCRCAVCRNRKASFNTMLCSMEQADCKYAMFCTLTYNTEFLPVMRVVKRVKTNRLTECEMYADTKRLPEYGKHLASYLSYDGEIDRILDKANLQGKLSYSSVADMQNFIKRFRDHVYRRTKETVRYYIVSEYGSQHYRVHFHVIFYFTSEAVLSVFSRCLVKSWQYGYSSYSLVAGSAASYVAQYVNSPIDFPSFYLDNKEIRPRATHSRFFGKGYFATLREKIYEPPYTAIDNLDRLCGDKIQHVFPWRGVVDTFFPRCNKFSLLAGHQVIKCYRAYYEYCCLFYIDQPVRQADDLCERLRECYTPRNSREKDFFTLVEYLFFNRMHLLFSSSKDDRKKFWTSVYNLFRVSKHFISFVCKWNTDYSYSSKQVDMIVDFYSHRELVRLGDFYKVQEDYLKKYTVEDLGYRAFYNNSEKLFNERKPIGEILRFNDVYTNNVIQSRIIASNRVKHKRLNDANSLLLNS